MDRSILYPTIDDIVFRVALEYENLYRGTFSKLDVNKISPTKREAIVTKTGIGYTKGRDDEFLLYLKLAPYIIKVDGEHYLFEGVPIGGNFKLEENLIAFTGPPKVLKKEHYHHPTVYPSNEISYGDGRRWRRPDINIELNKWYDTNQRSTLFKIAKWLDEGRVALQERCFDGVTRVHSLNRSMFQYEYRTLIDALRSGAKIVANK